MISYLNNSEIDKDRWDECVNSSNVGVPYALSWYLDLASPNWDALVLNNYDAVMPLPNRRKMGVRYLYSPIMCQQLGVFSKYNSESFIVNDFIGAIPSKFKWIEINLNKTNSVKLAFSGMHVSEKTNHVLKLNKSYEQIFSHYNKSHIKNIFRAKKNGISILVDSLTVSEFFDLKMKSFSKQNVFLKQYQKDNYYNLLNTLGKKGYLKIYTAYSDFEIVGSAVFIVIDNWCTLQSFNTSKGKILSAGYLIVDRFINDHSSSGLTLDFMGSNIKGIAFHNLGFGSAEDKYLFIKISKLPWWLNFIKK
ncbi:hypothetical protein CYCD_20070 [Tenuifilaceae bacterium CYCD]|nr:hypothetical protein CYCD_20070 [Tenuifilaceae bacterium CYCD]